MFCGVPFMQNMENDKDGTSSRLTEYGVGFQTPPTSWAAPVRPKSNTRSAVATSSVASPAKKHIKTPCSVSVTLLLRDYREERITVRAQQIASYWRRTVELSSFEGAAPSFCLFLSNSEGIAGRCSLLLTTAL